mgnify:CR=1 FL=1
MQTLRNIKQLVIPVILLCFASACQPTSKTERTSLVEQTDSCLSAPAHTYQVFIPAHPKNKNKLPLLVAIDSHGSGQMAIRHLKEAISNYPAILIASNLIQNNDPHYMQELKTLIADVKKRYPTGDLTYLAGFSGGARMVLNYAATHPVNGVIACGAFAGRQQIATIKSPVIGLIGTDDFNFPETAQYILNPTNAPENAHIELIHATHEWPSKKRLTNAFGWLYLSNKLNENTDKRQVKNYVKAQNTRIDSLSQKGELIQSVCIARNMASANAFESIESFHEKNKTLSENPVYRKQLLQMLKSLQFESKERKTYQKALLNKDRNWWEKEIAKLQKKIQSEPNKMKRMAYKRLKGFIGIICYSYSQRFCAQKDIPHLKQVLMVYRLIEPGNTDMKHFSEILEKLVSNQV